MNARLARLLMRPKATPVRLTQPFNVAAHWQTTRWAIGAVGQLWHIVGCQRAVRGIE